MTPEALMRFIDAETYTADHAWDALDIAEINSATVRLHWTDQPYVWHVNDGPEVFVVLDGAVNMHYRQAGQEHVQRLTPGRICHAEPGDEHVAHPIPQARILVIERKGSV
jgi:mannose-6-phosphate isomerase-like protein (cupin superfamily)